MMVTTLTKREKKAEAGDSKDQHAMILAFCSKMRGITRSACTGGAVNPRLGGQTGLNDGIFADSLRRGVSNGISRGKSRFIERT